MRAGRHYTAYRPSESRVADTVFRRPHMRTAGTAVVIRSDCVYDNGRRAGVAQSVEQRIRNAKVGGSIPFSGTISTDKRPSENGFQTAFYNESNQNLSFLFIHFRKAGIFKFAAIFRCRL